MEYHEHLWVNVHKGVQMQEVKMVNWSAKSFVHVQRMKSLKTLFFWSSSLETLNQKKQKIFIF